MILTVEADLEAALKELARQQGVLPEVLALMALRERFLPSLARIQPQDEWERRLLGVAIDCGVTLSDEVLGREALYE